MFEVMASAAERVGVRASRSDDAMWRMLTSGKRNLLHNINIMASNSNMSIMWLLSQHELCTL